MKLKLLVTGGTGFIDEERLLAEAENLKKNSYGSYLKKTGQNC